MFSIHVFIQYIGAYSSVAFICFKCAEGITDSLHFILIDLPNVSLNTTSYTKPAGSSVTLECTVSSQSAITSVFWTKYTNTDTRITSSTDTNRYRGSTPDTPSLTIVSAVLGDAGQYRCSAVNSDGTGHSTSNITLHVTGFNFNSMHLIQNRNNNTFYSE